MAADRGVERRLASTPRVRTMDPTEENRPQMEAADASVSPDLLVKSLLALGASRSEVGSVVSRA